MVFYIYLRFFFAWLESKWPQGISHPQNSKPIFSRSPYILKADIFSKPIFLKADIFLKPIFSQSRNFLKAEIFSQPIFSQSWYFLKDDIFCEKFLLSWTIIDHIGHLIHQNLNNPLHIKVDIISKPIISWSRYFALAQNTWYNLIITKNPLFLGI